MWSSPHRDRHLSSISSCMVIRFSRTRLARCDYVRQSCDHRRPSQVTRNPDCTTGPITRRNSGRLAASAKRGGCAANRRGGIRKTWCQLWHAAWSCGAAKFISIEGETCCGLRRRSNGSTRQSSRDHVARCRATQAQTGPLDSFSRAPLVVTFDRGMTFNEEVVRFESNVKAQSESHASS